MIAGRKTRQFLFAFALLLLIAHHMAPSTQAATCTVSWTNPAGELWYDPFNWDTLAVPSSTDDVCITMPGTYTVALQGTASVNSVTVGADQTLWIRGNGGIGDGNLITAGDIANAGMIRLESLSGYSSYMSAATLTNTGTVDCPP